MKNLNFKLPKVSRDGFLACFVLLLPILVAYFCFPKEKESEKPQEIPVLEEEEEEEEILEISTEQKDSVLAKYTRTLLNRYRPPNAFVLLMDAKSADILAWGQRKDDENSEEPSFLKRDSFPAASLAKIVTTVAALESGKDSKSGYPKIGRNSTLYKRQIFPKGDHISEMITLEDAFARSNNPAMGIAGLEIGRNKMQETADKLGFMNFDYPDSDYELAESSCGFTKRNLISPLQISLAIRKLIFTQPKKMFKETTYSEMRYMFLRTVTNGTARRDMQKTIYSYNKNSFDIGGKTGSLDGDSPEGRYDWFAGFAESKSDPEKAVIVVVMQVHGRLRNQHSSIIAGMLINEWAKKLVEKSGK